MKWKVATGGLLALLACAGVAQAAGVFDGSSTQSLLKQRVQVLTQRLERGEATASVNSSRKKPARGPRGKRGPRGVRGPAGPAGATGPAGSFSSITVVEGAPVTLATSGAGRVGASEADCPAGTKVISGGWKGGGVEMSIAYSAPVSEPEGWGIIAVNNDIVTASPHAVALCAN